MVNQPEQKQGYHNKEDSNVSSLMLGKTFLICVED